MGIQRKVGFNTNEYTEEGGAHTLYYCRRFGRKLGTLTAIKSLNSSETSCS